MFDEDHILDDLNHCLREAVLAHSCRHALIKSPFFRLRPELNFINDVINKFHFQVVFSFCTMSFIKQSIIVLMKG